MDEKNVYYRAFWEYKKRTSGDKNIQKLCEAIARASTDSDSLESIRTYCVIDEDWIEIIEAGMDHVEKAIREERQFIRKEGEVVPIEKLKRVSTATVQHLARHSDLITKEPEEGEDLIPERLYMAENLSDFTVYENRFLYMLLCYLRDFINVRLDKIQELGRTYRLHTEVDKNVRIGRQHLKYKASLYFEDKNDPLSDDFFASSSIIERIKTAQRLVVSLLMTPLMKEVSKAPMIQPPITRTNVLRMNVHFKAALEMYGKIAAYNKPGYRIEELKNSYRPLPDALMSEISETIALEKFLSYKYGNKLSDSLREEFELEEKKRKEQELLDRQAKIEALKKRVHEDGKSMEEYMLLLEEQNRQREKDSVDLRVARKQIENLNEKIENLNKNIESQNAEIARLNEHADGLEDTILKKDRELSALQAQLEQEKVRAQREADALRKEVEKEREEELAKIEQTRQEADAEIAKRRDEVEKERIRVREENTLVKAQLHGLRQQHGLITDEEDFTSEERFLELEAEFSAFQELFEKQWKCTKKRIRKEILWQRPNKGSDKKADKKPDKD